MISPWAAHRKDYCSKDPMICIEEKRHEDQTRSRASCFA